MDLEPNELQVELADAVRKLCGGRYPMETIRASIGGVSVDRGRWAELADAGVFSLRLPESAGGLGLSMADAGVVFQELGRALVPGPLVASQLAAGLVDGAADGTTVVGLVEARHTPILIEHLASTDRLLLLSDDGVRVVDARALRGDAVARPLDPLSPVTLVESFPVAEELGGADLALRLRLEGACLTAALLSGNATASTVLATHYAKGREQFGRAIGSFQAVKHLLADMLARAELARAAVDAAAVTVDQPDAGDVMRAVSVAKLLAGEAAILNGKSAIQVHGGMGFTWEVDAHLFLKRAWVLETHFGAGDDHAESLAATLV